MTRRLLASGAMLGALFSLSAWCDTQAATCLRLDDPTVTLRGTVIVKTFFGPPNYGENPETDSRETQALLKLDQPACVAMGQDDGTVQQERQSLVTLVPGSKIKLSPYRGKQVTVRGSLFQAFTGHHHTDVLIDVKHIAGVK